MSSPGPGFTVLYRWRLHAGAEPAFIEAWSRVTELLRAERGALGSRLHRGPDRLWYGYAQWPSAQAREEAFAGPPVDREASRRMREAIAETLPELVLESVSDFLVLPPPDAPPEPAHVPAPPAPGAVNASVFVGISLDGFLARPDGAFDFLPGDGGGEAGGFAEFLASVDAIVMGRKTYETVLPLDPWPYGTKPVCVLSSNPLAPAPPGARVERLSGDPSAIAATLAARGVREVYVDGGDTIQRFLRAGLVRRLVLTRVPVLIGAGIPLFGALPRDVHLRLVAHRSLGHGLLQDEYAVLP